MLDFSINILIVITLQKWLNKEYPNKEQLEQIVIKFSDFQGKDEEHLLSLKNYPKLKEIKINEKEIYDKNRWYTRSPLTKLEISDCPELESLICSNNSLTVLKISNCPQIEEFDCNWNRLTDLKELDNFLNPEKLTRLVLSSNDFPPQNLTIFSKYINLKELFIDNNSFTGSLEPLKHINGLKRLFITNTDLDSGIEYLPDKIRDFRCLADALGKGKKVKAIEKELYKVRGQGFIENYADLLPIWKKPHLKETLFAQPHLFTDPNTKDEWIEALNTKMDQIENELQKTELSGEIISELKGKLAILKLAKVFLEKITTLEAELQMEREEAEKALIKAQEWRERQIKEIKEQKNKEIKNLQEKVEQLASQLANYIQVLPKSKN
jgi:hypothetical protein